MKDVPTDTPFIFFHWLICVSPFQDFVGVMAMLICSAGHDRLSRACSAPSSMPNDLKYKAIVTESCRGLQVESDASNNKVLLLVCVMKFISAKHVMTCHILTHYYKKLIISSYFLH